MFYLLDKQKGISSFKAIKDFAREKGIKKVGHTGTLDPLATGLLLIATDADTKLIDYIDKGFKTYVATASFGRTSDTYDSEGEINDTPVYNKPTLDDIVNALKTFEGQTMQLPPNFSAKRINGVRAYDLARQGKEVKLKESKVTMKDFKIISYDDLLVFEVTVSRGTYIRSLIHDLGVLLKCGAIMTDLRRTAIGFLNESDLGKEIDIEKMLTIPAIEITDITDLKNGKVIGTNNGDGQYALKYNNDIVGIVRVEDKKMKVEKLLGNKL